MNKNYYCVIMAGGVGARFWPLSRNSRPKQFIDILGTGETLIQQTFRRLTTVCPPENIFVVTHLNYYDQVLEQLPAIVPEHVLCEPMRRNTAPCIAYATHKIHKLNPNASIVVAPSDHIILKEEEFTQTLLCALQAATQNDWLLTLGITPSRPDTGYGYIQFDEAHAYQPDCKVRKVKTFTEKPNHALAESFLQSGDFLWNAGIFIWNTKSILHALEKNLLEVYDAFAEAEPALCTEKENAAVEKAFVTSPSISVDYGIMEKAENVYTLPASFGWSDLGTWASLYVEKEKDYLQNAVNGKNVVVYDSNNNIINVPDEKLVVIQGLENFIVVDTDDVLLICNKDEEQRIKEFTHDIKMRKGDKYL